VKQKKNPLRKGIRSIFLAGIITILPLGFTVFVVIFLVNLLGNITGRVLKYVPALSSLPTYVITIIGFFTLMVLIFLIGTVTSSFIGRWFIKLTDRFFSKLPFVRSVYSSARQLTDTLFIDRSALKEVVVIEYPRKGIYTLAFVTNDKTWEIKRRTKIICVNVFVPTSPNPTSGFYLLIPEKDIIPTGLPIEWGFKIIVSGGIVLPKERKIGARRS